MKKVLLVLLPFLFSSCSLLQDYNSRVAAREDTLSGYAKDDNIGAAWTHRVEYKK